eukprot:jgi/Chlat1/3802/Chrsp259S03933
MARPTMALALLLASLCLLASCLPSTTAQQQEAEFTASLKDTKPAIDEKAGKFSCLKNDLLKEMGYVMWTIELDSCGVAFPYTDEFAYACYITSGELVWRSTVRGMPSMVMGRVKEGDMIMMPRSHADAFHNPTQDKACIVCLSRVTPKENKYMPDPPTMMLAGDKDEMKGVLKGFDIKTLAAAFNVDEDKAKQLTKKRGLISFDYDRQCKQRGSDRDVPEPAPANGMVGMRSYVCPIKRMPAFMEEHGSCGKLCNEATWPSSKDADFGGLHVTLKKGTMTLPNYRNNAVTVGYVTKGKITFEMVNTKGNRALRKEMKEGDVIIIPPMYAHTYWADCNEDAEIVGFIGCAFSPPVFLAGNINVYKALKTHEGYLGTVFDMDEKEVCELFDKQKSCVFAPNPMCGQKEESNNFIKMYKK